VTLLRTPVGIASVGVELFATELVRQDVLVRSLEWAPPSPEAQRALARLAATADRVARANDEAVRRLRETRPLLVDVARAVDVIPGMDERTFLHAGPPIEWSEMPGPMRGAVVGAALFEGLGASPEEVVRAVERGAVRFAPNHEHSSVAPMAGVVSPSAPVWVIENDPVGNRATAPVNEGMGRVLRFGAFHREHVEHLAWMRDRMMPVLRQAVRQFAEPLDLRAMIAQALQMGDECHNRHKAGSALFLREMAPVVLRAEAPMSDLAAVVAYLANNEIFFLNPTMAAAKASLDAVSGIGDCSVVTVMTRNGRRFGIRLSGTGDQWFTGPASAIDGLFFPGYGPEDANPDLGDSAITETWGLGGFAVAASQAVLRSVGGTIEESMRVSRSMYEITCAESPHFQIPALGFRGTPLAIDAREVVHTGILPVINTGIAHRDPGVGQIGAGVVRPQMAPFVDALAALAGGGG
jgi:Protein of unknown function (DUF1116)